MKCDQGEVCKAKSKKADGRHEQNKWLPEFKACRFIFLLFKDLRIRVSYLCCQNKSYGDHCRNKQYRKRDPICCKKVVCTFYKSCYKKQYRSEKRAKLIQKLLIGKAFSGSDLACRKAYQCVFGRLFYRFSDTLQDHKTAGPNPAMFRYECQCRNRQSLYYIACDNKCPVFLRFICYKSGYEP